MIDLTQAKYISPSGIEILFVWKEVSRSVSHTTTTVDYPQFSGGDVIDLGHGIESYPLECRFYGADYQRNSDRFYEALKELGSGVLEHPRWGALSVIPQDFSQKESYVDGLNLSIVAVTFIITGEKLELRMDSEGNASYHHERLTPSQTIGDPLVISDQHSQAQEVLRQQVVITAPSPSIFAKFNRAVRAPLQKVNQLLGRGWRLAGQWQGSFSALEHSIDGLLNTPQHVVDIVGAFLSPIKGLVKGERMQFLASLSTLFRDDENNHYSPIEDEATISAKASGALVSNSMLAISAMQLAIQTNEELTSREEASQLLFVVQAIEHAYMDSLEQSFAMVSLGAPAVRVELASLMSITFGSTKALIYQRMMTLKLKLTRTLAHAMPLYDALFLLYGAVDEAQVEQFISLNNLTDDDIFLLPAGREVSYYA
ncbi:DNA circularization N-terminal domain-containing protein (plasmid) [Entomospira entomophila]|uniref:DNA circulation N-terminal domain-containing protein n=1 Tax=Entomospira entomophila TaxID=2719988 RepID=A0A968KX53_9SPIO|nr:DNA circularization N-terminal domain-containing protein [Entomospira entomophilus]NIZ41505.1 hypothetical protein [Entomospira entomophilus]WDI36411.1 DNA circularization N-terminal domain-containing protein [Entomospira entomophilus]